MVTFSGPDRTYQRAVEKKRKLEEEIAKIREEIARVDLFLSLYSEFAQEDDDLARIERSGVAARAALMSGVENSRVPASPPAATSPGDSASGMSQATFIRLLTGIMREHGRPMEAAQVQEEFRKRGHPIGGADELKNVGNKLWRGKKGRVLLNIRGEGYWLIDTPCPAIGYEPPPQNREGSSREASEMQTLLS